MVEEGDTVAAGQGGIKLLKALGKGAHLGELGGRRHCGGRRDNRKKDIETFPLCGALGQQGKDCAPGRSAGRGDDKGYPIFGYRLKQTDLEGAGGGRAEGDADEPVKQTPLAQGFAVQLGDLDGLRGRGKCAHTEALDNGSQRGAMGLPGLPVPHPAPIRQSQEGGHVMGFWIREGIWGLGLKSGARKGDLTRVGADGEVRGSRGRTDGAQRLDQEDGKGDEKGNTDGAWGHFKKSPVRNLRTRGIG